ncbi:hypothetical protein [Sulfurisphaera ohwakuensis]|uniref:Uncharacterized protein n=1 Tax=Sulfurisphaera ohwakuensis TaxID=69656 RepID=A0A650CJT3_SULOH|nr:hypothetical protein [Sulfurisphaera ohwakuensis]MBB5254722.1 hypothetical protein [Sulfurisphaera ohwakuensis]QGR18076.1 hypothetical protein D1869_13420 [Sulfurisphaera ohwakuensis]
MEGLEKQLSTIRFIGGLLYFVNIFFSASIYTALESLGLAKGSLIFSLLFAVPLWSAVVNGVILGLIIAQLKDAVIYGIMKSVIAIVIYSLYLSFFSLPLYIVDLALTIIGLCVIQLGVLYLYRRIQKKIFG